MTTGVPERGEGNVRQVPGAGEGVEQGRGRLGPVAWSAFGREKRPRPGGEARGTRAHRLVEIPDRDAHGNLRTVRPPLNGPVRRLPSPPVTAAGKGRTGEARHRNCTPVARLFSRGQRTPARPGPRGRWYNAEPVTQGASAGKPRHRAAARREGPGWRRLRGERT